MAALRTMIHKYIQKGEVGNGHSMQECGWGEISNWEYLKEVGSNSWILMAEGGQKKKKF